MKVVDNISKILPLTKIIVETVLENDGDDYAYLIKTDDTAVLIVSENYEGGELPSADVLIGEGTLTAPIYGTIESVIMRGGAGEESGLYLNGKIHEENDIVIRALKNLKEVVYA